MRSPPCRHADARGLRTLCQIHRWRGHVPKHAKREKCVREKRGLWGHPLCVVCVCMYERHRGLWGLPHNLKSPSNGEHSQGMVDDYLHQITGSRVQAWSRDLHPPLTHWTVAQQLDSRKREQKGSSVSHLSLGLSVPQKQKRKRRWHLTDPNLREIRRSWLNRYLTWPGPRASERKGR